ncbi:MAG TPA: hypothetical protein VNJ08_10465 [Bacteriovoracaceae bacterium]|nr:hypothetical protein [Bacteriovoracaceae bacterium]
MDEIILKLYAHFPKFLTRAGQFDSRISGLDALLIWQYVRYCKSYRLQYNSYKKNLDDDMEKDLFCLRLGMSEPVDYKQIELPPDFYFHQTLIKYFDIHKFQNDEVYRNKTKSYLRGFVSPQMEHFSNPERNPSYAFVINLNDDPDTIAKMVKKEIIEMKKQREIGHPELIYKAKLSHIKNLKKMKGSSKKFLMDWLITYYYRKVEKLSLGEVRKKHKAITGKSPDNTQIGRQLENFKNHADSSPRTFFFQTF